MDQEIRWNIWRLRHKRAMGRCAWRIACRGEISPACYWKFYCGICHSYTEELIQKWLLSLIKKGRLPENFNPEKELQEARTENMTFF